MSFASRCLGAALGAWLAALAMGCSCGAPPAPPIDGGSDALGEPRVLGAVTVTHYDYRLDLESGRASADVSLTADTAANCFTLPFRAASPALDTVTLDGARAIARVEGDALVTCGPSWPAGRAMVLHAEMTVLESTLGSSQVGYSRVNDGRADFWLLISWVGGCDRFGPCDHRPDRFATYRFTIEHAPGVVVRCPGTIDEISPTETRCDFPYAGGPTYSTFGLVASTGYTTRDLEQWGSVHVTLYDTGSDTPAQLESAYHDEFVTLMESWFGPYPYGTELRVLTGPTYWSGFEHPGNIVLYDSLPATAAGSYYLHPLAHVLDHEIAHQWAGDRTTLADTYDFVWKEAMAEYLAYLHEDMRDPAAAARTLGFWHDISEGAAYFPVPEEHPPLIDYYGDVYGPGPMVLFRQIEGMSSREAVLRALQRALAEPRALSVTELRDLLAEETGLALGPYFDAWVLGTGAPDWPLVAVAYDGATQRLSVTRTNAGSGPMPCVFHVALTGAAGERALVPVDLRDGDVQSIAAPALTFIPTATELDPAHECLVYPSGDGRALRARHEPGFSPWRAPARATP